MFTLILLIILIIVLDGFISAAEAAILSVPINRAKMLAQKSENGRKVLILKESMERPITTLVSLSNLIVIVGSMLVGIQAAKIFGENLVGIFAAFLTFLIIIFAEIVPKRLGERYNEFIALRLAPFIQWIGKVFSPAMLIIERIVSLFPIKKKGPSVSEEEIKFLVELGKKEGAIEEHESRFIRGVFKLNDVTASDMMTPRPFIFALDGSRTLGEAREDIKGARHSRIPVFDRVLDNIIGVVHQRDLLRALVNERQGVLIKDYAQKPLIIPESRLGDDLLRDFISSRSQLAIVVNEHGSVAGVVAFEDIIEELIGEVISERDVSPEMMKRLSRNEVLIHGLTPISYLNRFFNIELPGHKTLNGFLLDWLGHLPKSGESFQRGDITFIVEKTSPSSIELVRITKEEK